MLKQRVKYQGFDGELIEEDLYFNLTRMDLIELNDRYESKDMAAYIDKIVKEKNIKELYKVLKDIVLMAYGVKSEDGKRFIKNQTVKDEFAESLAFSQLIEDFHETDTAMSDFVTGITSQIKGLELATANLA
ncbi:MAG: hypothetical protein EOM28_13320 [Clostridia bacterium]|nr:hypothetical protein [Clostridia bacterium]